MKRKIKKGNTENHQRSGNFTKNRFQMIQVEQIGPLQSLKKQDSWESMGNIWKCIHIYIITSILEKNKPKR